MEVQGYRFTIHALENLKERNYIKLEWIEMTLKNPDLKEIFSVQEVHFIKRISEYGNRFLRVVVNPQKKTLITYFFDRRLKMRVRYDKEADALFIRFSDKPSVESEMIEPGIIVDYSEDNRVVALEILNASERIELLNSLKDLAKAA